MAEATYTCPFCGTVIKDGIDSLVEHRKDNGVCEQKMAKIYGEVE